MTIPNVKTLAFDFNNALFAAEAVGGKFKTSTGVRTGGAFVLLRSVISRMKRENADSVYFLMDDYPTWRHRVYPEYKGDRAYNEEVSQLRRAQRDIFMELSSALPFVFLRATGLEADDLAHSCASAVQKYGTPLTLVSTDKDWLQLVSDHTSVVSGKVKVTIKNFERVTGWRNTTEFLLEQILAGGHDNIPSLGPIKDRKAKIQQFFDDPCSLPEIGEILRTEEGERNTLLVGLRSKDLIPDENIGPMVPIINLYDKDRLMDLLVKYEFNSMIKKIDEIDAVMRRVIQVFDVGQK